MGTAVRARMPWAAEGDVEAGRKTSKLYRMRKKYAPHGWKLFVRSNLGACTILMTCVLLSVMLVVRKVELWHGRVRRETPDGSTTGQKETVLAQTAENMLDAVVYIAIAPEQNPGRQDKKGRDGATGMMRLSIESLRKVGQYMGEVYVITDMEQVLHIPEIYNSANLIHFEGFGRLGAAEGNYYNAVCDLKTRIFEYVPLSVETVLYLDTDVVVSAPLEPLLIEMSRMFDRREEGNVPSMAAFQNNAPCGNGYPCWHAGVLYMTRERSLPCLSIWHDLHMSNAYPLCMSKRKNAQDSDALPAECNDQSALSWASHVAQPCRQIHRIEDRAHLKWMNSASLGLAVMKLMASPRTFSHFTHNTRRNGHLGTGVRGRIYRFLVTRLFLSCRLGLQTPFDL